MSSPQANFQDIITSIYFENTLASRAPKLIRAKKNIQLADLLRFYRENAITCPNEIDVLTPIDDLLKYYSVMELAATAGCIHPPDDSTLWKEAKWILENGEVRKYYREFYPLKLPQLFLLRLQRHHTAMANDDPVINFFPRFFEMDRLFTKSLENGCLLRMLDGFRVDGYWFTDMLPLFRDKNPLMEHALSAEDGDVKVEVLVEFATFLRFCSGLRKLLNTLEKQPLLQSELWNHYAYWFDTMGKQVRLYVNAALDQLLISSTAIGKNTALIESYVTAARISIEDLTSEAYAGVANDVLTAIS
jgi:hypothetical protein